MKIDELEKLAKLPWSKLIVSNGVAGIVGAIILVSYFNTSVFSQKDGLALKEELREMKNDLHDLTIHLIPRQGARFYRKEESSVDPSSKPATIFKIEPRASYFVSPALADQPSLSR